MGNEHEEGRQLPPLGDGGLNLPYEANAEPVPVMLHSHAAGGVVILAATNDIPGMGTYPALVFRFVRPDGTFFPDFLLTARPAELKALATVIADTVDGAIAGAAQAR